MQAPIFNYALQQWETIDTDTDEHIGQHVCIASDDTGRLPDRLSSPMTYRTPTGITYERNPVNPEEYRGVVLVDA